MPTGTGGDPWKDPDLGPDGTASQPGVAPGPGGRSKPRGRWLVRLKLAVASGLALLVLGYLLLLLDAYRERGEALQARIGELVFVERTPREGPPGCVCEAIRLRSSTGLWVDLTLLRRPHDPSAPLVPAAVVLGGHRTGRDAALLVGDPGLVVVAALDYPLEGAREIRGLAALLGALPEIRRALLDTGPAAALAARWLSREPGVDPGAVEILGVSLGAVFGPLAAGLEPGVSRLWLVHGGAEPGAWLDHSLKRKIGSSLARRAVSHLAYLLGRGPSFDPQPWLRRLAPRELVVIAAEDDKRLPRALIEALIEEAPCAVRLGWTAGGHVDPKKPELVRVLIGMVLAGIAGEPPPLVRPAPESAG